MIVETLALIAKCECNGITFSFGLLPVLQMPLSYDDKSLVA